MATVGQGDPSSSSHPFQKMNGNSSHNHDAGYVGGQMRLKLQALLDDKERQLQKAEALGQRILAQQMELEERINQITELDENGGGAQAEDGDSEMRSQLDELAQTMHGWATENDSLWTGAVTKDGPGDAQDISQFEGDGETVTSTPSAAQSSRRAKNAAHRANDVEFAFEIGSGLLTEIRRLQSLLAERDKSLLDMKEEKDDMDRSLDSLRTALRTQEANAEKFREENWNLEVTLQELRNTHTDTQAALQRSEAEHKRTQKQLTTFRESAESHKTESERLATVLEEAKSKHETDVAQMRKQAATLQREKGELQTNVENLKAEVVKKSRTVARFGSPMTPNDPKFLTPARPSNFEDEEGEDVFGTAASTRRRLDSSLVFGDTYEAELDALSPETSPIKNATAARSPIFPNQAASELESLKQALAHAHRQLGTVKGSLNRERQLRTEYGRKLESMGAPVPVPEGLEENDEDYEDEPGELPRVTPLRAGRGRGGKPRAGATRPNARTSLAVKLALAEKAGKPAHHFDSPAGTGARSADGHELPVADFSMGDQEEWVDLDDDGYAPRRRSEDRDSIAAGASETETESGDLVGRRLRGLSAVSISSSTDGLDPAYANVLKSRDSRASSDMGHRTSTDSGYIGTRAGNALGGLVGESRPGSVFDAPGTLASELGGLGDASAVGDEDRLRAELGLGDEDEEEIEEEVTPEGHHVGDDTLDDIPAIVPVPAKPVVEMAEMGTQCDLLLPPPPPPLVPVIERVTISVQTVEVPPPPPVVTEEISIQTDALLEPEKVAVVAPAPIRHYADGSAATDPTVASPSGGRRVPLEIIGTAAGGVAGAIIANKRDSTASKRNSVASKRDSVASKRDSKVPPSAFKDPSLPMSSSRTDTDTDGETDYEDARETVGGTTPTQSLGDGDFYSVNEVENSDSAGSDTDSAESIKVSRMHVKRAGIGASTGTDMAIRDAMSQAEDTSKRDTIVPAAKVEDVKPKPEVKEISVQTDDWTPPIPAGTALFTVGPQSQQFQFIPGPSTPGINSIALPTGAAVAVATGAGILKAPGTPRAGILASGSSGSISGDTRPRLPSATLSVNASPKAVDRTRPPTMMLPPPPRLPPPPMSTPGTKPGPPNMGPPPRPTSPPPPELLQRATTPSISRGSTLVVPPVIAGRTISQQTRSTSGATTSSQGGQTRMQNGNGSANAGEHGVLQDPFDDNAGRPAQKSMASMGSSRRSVSSRRQSISSSISSDHVVRMMDTPRSNTLAASGGSGTAAAAGGMMGALSRGGPSADNATDPMIIHAITQTMIGEYLYKYTRKPIGKKHAERRHRRYFWIHPYTKTIYWSAVDPGSSNVTESSAKSAYIESVKSVMDPNPMPPGLHQYSVIVTTANREMKFTAPTKERHDIWFNALNYLLARPSTIGQQPAAREPLSPTSVNTQPRLPPSGPSNGTENTYATRQVDESRHFDHSPRSQRSAGSALTVDSWNATQRGGPTRSLSRMSNPYGSVGKRSGTAAAEFMRWDAPASPTPQQPEEAADFHLHDHDDAYDGLDNVRACCDGKHDVGSLGSRHHHHHHHNQQSNQQQQGTFGRQQQQQQQQQSNGMVRSTSEAIPDRPASPSGWSFRSGRSKGGSAENGGMFSWSRRSRQNSAVRP